MYNDASYNRVGAGPRLFALTLLVVVLSVGGALWFDFLGLIDVTSTFAPVLRLVGLEPRTEPAVADDPLLLEEARMRKRETALSIRADELDRREVFLDDREAELQTLAQQLREKEATLQDRENSVSEAMRQVENERAALVRLSTHLTNMPPQDAVSIMVNYPDRLLLNVLLMTDELAVAERRLSLVPFWLSLMPPARAATIGERLEMLPELDGGN